MCVDLVMRDAAKWYRARAPDVVELHSPPRILREAGLRAYAGKRSNLGWSLDPTTDDPETGKPWNLADGKVRAKANNLIFEGKPFCVIRSPMCTAFSILQGLNKAKMEPAKWNALWDKGVRHMLFAIKLYRLQADAGWLFLHEHPSSASSWQIPEMIALMRDLNIEKINAHMCRFGMMREDENGGGLVKKPTGFLTNSEYLKDQLARKCMGGHRHVHLMGGRAKTCQVYPPKLVKAICKGIML